MVYVYSTPPHVYRNYEIQCQVPVDRSMALPETVAKNMKVEVDGPSAIAEKDTSSMQPPSTYPQPSGQASGDSTKPNTKRRQSRFDPMGHDSEEEEEEGYGDLGHRHPLRKLNEEEPRTTSFSLPGIRSLLNPSSGKPLSHQPRDHCYARSSTDLKL